MAGGGSDKAYRSVVDGPLCDSLTKRCVDSELALVMEANGASESWGGGPIIVLRLDLRLSKGSCEDLERKRLRRLWTLGEMKKAGLSES